MQESKLKKHKVTLTDQELNTVGIALGLLPFKDASPLIANLQQQLNKKPKTVLNGS